MLEDVDFDRKRLRVRHAADENGVMGPAKSKNGYREIPLLPNVGNTLREWKLACPRYRRDGFDLVFPGQRGAVINHSTLQEAFAGVQQTAGVIDEAGEAKYSLHALRHFYASWHIERGTEPKRLQQLMGHGSIRMTYDTYGHWLGDLAEEANRLAEDEAAILQKSR